MKHLVLIMVYLLCFVLSVSAQNEFSDNQYSYEKEESFDLNTEQMPNVSEPKNQTWDHLTINSDSRINDLLEIQKEESIRKGGIDGYRVQIYQGTKDEAYQIKARFMSLYSDFPESEVYVKFLTPDFRVRIGDFRTRSEAINLKYKIIKDFPNPFIVEDIINFPEVGL